MSKMSDRDRKVVESYLDHDEDDISSERLLQMVMDDTSEDIDMVCRILMEHNHTINRIYRIRNIRERRNNNGCGKVF